MGKLKKVIPNKQKSSVIVIILIYFFIYIGIGTSTVTGIRDVIHSGYLEGVEYIEEDKQYKVNQEEVHTYPKYRYGVAFGEENQFNYALDGFSYTDTVGIGRKTFIYDYSWSGDREFKSTSIKNYIDENYWVMVFRIVAYSNQLVVSIILFIGLIILNKWLMPITTHLMTSLFGLIMALRGLITKDKESIKIQIYEARLLRQTVESYENSVLFIWAMGLIALHTSLYTIRYHEESAVYVALWVNITFILFYILNKIAKQHIKIVKQYKTKENG